MELQEDIGFDQLVALIRKLPAQQRRKLKTVIEQSEKKIIKNRTLEKFLLEAPTFSKSQLERITETRNEINQWRTK